MGNINESGVLKRPDPQDSIIFTDKKINKMMIPFIPGLLGRYCYHWTLQRNNGEVLTTFDNVGQKNEAKKLLPNHKFGLIENHSRHSYPGGVLKFQHEDLGKNHENGAYENVLI